MDSILRRTLHAAANRLRVSARSEDGFTIVEVVVTAMIVSVVAGAAMTGIDAAGQTSADLRNRSQAHQVAQEDQERMRGMTANQLGDYNPAPRTQTRDGTVFTVTSSARFLSNSSAGSSCTTAGDGSADYIQTNTSVTWGTNRRATVVAESIIAPPSGGTVITRVVDENQRPIAGVTVSAYGRGTEIGTTNAQGCVIFGGMELGGYYLLASKPGFIDEASRTTSVQGVTTTASTSANKSFTLGEAAAIGAEFTTKIGTAPPYIDQRAPSLSWHHAGWAVAKETTLLSTPVEPFISPQTLFPFINGIDDYDPNYTTWAGTCDADQPPQADRTWAEVRPGATGAPANVTIPMPALDVRVFYPTFAPANRRRPNRIELTDACNQQWAPQVRADAATNMTFGSLDYPGQPYSTGYDVCAEYDPDGTGGQPRRSFTVPNVPNTNFNDSNPVNVTISATSSTSPC